MESLGSNFMGEMDAAADWIDVFDVWVLVDDERAEIIGGVESPEADNDVSDGDGVLDFSSCLSTTEIVISSVKLVCGESCVI